MGFFFLYKGGMTQIDSIKIDPKKDPSNIVIFLIESVKCKEN